MAGDVPGDLESAGDCPDRRRAVRALRRQAESADRDAGEIAWHTWVACDCEDGAFGAVIADRSKVVLLSAFRRDLFRHAVRLLSPADGSPAPRAAACVRLIGPETVLSDPREVDAALEALEAVPSGGRMPG